MLGEGLSLFYIGRVAPLRCVAAALAANMPYLLIHAFTLHALASAPELIGWSLLLAGLPILIYLAACFLAWPVKILLLCWLAGPRPGAIVGAVVFPALVTVLAIALGLALS